MKRNRLWRAIALSLTAGVIATIGPSATLAGVNSEQEQDPVAALADAIETLEPQARDLWPESFAGVWLGEEGVGGTIFIAFTDGAKERVAALADSFPQPELLQPVTLDSSMTDLEARQDVMIAERELVRLGELVLPGVSGAEYDLDIEVSNNALVVLTEDDDPVATESFKARYGDDLIVEITQVAVPECTRSDCRYELRSGLETVDPGEGSCSTAFAAKTPDGTRQILSAAHCGGSGSGDIGNGRRHGGERYGEVREQQFRWRVDAERHRVDGAGFSARPWCSEMSTTSSGKFDRWAHGRV